MVLVVAAAFVVGAWLMGWLALPGLIRFIFRAIGQVTYFVVYTFMFALFMVKGIGAMIRYTRTHYNHYRPHIRQARREVRTLVPMLIRQVTEVLHSFEEQFRAHVGNAQPGTHANRPRDEFRNPNAGNQRLYPDLPDDISSMDSGELSDSNTEVEYDNYSSTPSDLNMSWAPNEERPIPTAPTWEDHDDGQDSACVVCMENVRNTAVFPCGHTHLCGPCARAIIRGRNVCPICQTPITEYRTVFL